MAKYVISLDQGTTSSRAIVFDDKGNIVAQENKEFEQIYPYPGWVEHNPDDILHTQVLSMRNAVYKSKVNVADIVSIGITNQRETTIVWDKNTGRPIYNAIVWQCRRSADICSQLKNEGYAEMIHKKTGLLIDAYFSATKLKWILDNVEGARQKAQKGNLLFGTVDTWIIWNLTKGKKHVTDFSNASRTMMFNIFDKCWDKDILNILDIPECMLPTVVNSSEIVEDIDSSFLGKKIPIAGIAGDQQAALFGQCCFEKGMAKNTYGTGCFMLMNTGSEPIMSKHDLITTIAWSIDNKVEYALEGSVFMAGAAIGWLRDELKLISSSNETETIANEVEDNGGVYIVPAFTGLGAPYWDMYARGTIVGLTRGSNRAHLVRATLESIAFQTKDVIETMKEDSKIGIPILKVDGGASVNNFLMQFQADMLNIPVLRSDMKETTALGAAYLAGLATGVWKSKDEIQRKRTNGDNFMSQMSYEKAKKYYSCWKKAVERAKLWEMD